ncbi:MAG: hypothetical protein E6G96_18775 [Alphaproteobacteria bacterium]|nr:MAG: hypothetical protein E6G96_18775 [Alphaproteobacteria bacterium]
MADYYPLIARAVAGLEKNSGENRRALYERARAALIAQLRGVTPALDESDITRERLALEESIRKVEAEAARKFVDTPPRQPSAPKNRPIEARPAAADVEDQSAPARRYVNPPAQPSPQPRQPPRQEPRQELRQDPRQQSRQESRPESRQDPRQGARQDPRLDAERHPRTPIPAVMPRSSLPALAKPAETRRPAPAADAPLASETPASQPRHPLRRMFIERRPEEEPKPPRSFATDNLGQADAPLRAEKSPRNAYTLPPVADLDRLQRPRDRAQDRPQDRARESDRDRPQDLPPLDQPGTIESEMPEETSFEQRHDSYARGDFSEPMLESAFPVDDAHSVPGREHHDAAIDEDRAEREVYRPLARARELLAWRPSRELIRGLAAAAVGLALVGILAWQWRNMVEFYRAMRAAPVETARETQPPVSTARPKITDRIEPGSSSTSTAPAPGTQASAAVAQKVVLYEEDPADPNGKRFVAVTPGPGQTPELAIRADVEVPERKLAMTWSLRRNTDKTLPASHTVEIVFRLPTDFPAGGISNVPGILMKQAEQTRGVPLSGLAVKVTNGFFLIGLSSVDADKERNLQLLKDRAWFDIPVVYNNNRRAILAMEKGTPGERVFAEAFKVWKQ